MQFNSSSMGAFNAQDSSGKTIVLHWERVDGKSPCINQKIREVGSILAQTYTRQELEFAKAHPESVSSQYFLNAIAPLFREGAAKVDWALAKEQLLETFNEMFSASNFEQYVSDNESSIFVIARDPDSDVALGVIQFVLTPDFPQGTIKSAYFGISPCAQDRGLELLLMSAGFRLVPQTLRIFMHTRPTNKQLISLYQTWGFTEFTGTLPHWIDLEYLASQSDFIQNKAKDLKPLSLEFKIAPPADHILEIH